MAATPNAHELGMQPSSSSFQYLRPRESAGLVSELLDQAAIPSVIWGTLALSHYNVPTVILEVAVVIPDEYFESAISIISNTDARRCLCQEQRSTDPCHSFLVPSPPAHWLITNEFGIDLWTQSSVLWRLHISPSSLDLTSQQVTMPTGQIYTVRHPKLHKLIESYMLLAMRDYGTVYSSSRAYPILYIRQYTDPEHEGCNELGDTVEETVVKEAYQSDDWADMLEKGHNVLFI